MCFLLVPLYASISTHSKGTCAKPLIYFFNRISRASYLLRQRRPPQLTKHIRNTRVSCIPTFDGHGCSTLHPLNLIIVGLLVWAPDSGTILHKRENQRKVSSLHNLRWAALQVATLKRKLGLALFVMVAICFDHSKSLLSVTPVLSVNDFLQYLSCQ